MTIGAYDIIVKWSLGYGTRFVGNSFKSTFNDPSNLNDAVIEAIDVEIISEDIPGWLVANEGNITIALDVTITDELKQEGIARDIVNRVQNIRKSRDYDITDKISLVFAPNADTDAAINAYSDYIARQVLATNITIGDINGAEGVETLEIDEIKVDVSITK